jgi:hypothetical protein
MDNGGFVEHLSGEVLTGKGLQIALNVFTLLNEKFKRTM